MPEGVKIGGGYVDVTADMTNFDNAMNALPKKAASKMESAMKAIQAQVAQKKIEIGLAWKSGASADQVQKLGEELARLEAKSAAVQHAATKQATALQQAAVAAQQAKAATKGFGSDAAMSLMLLGQALDDVQYGRRCRAAA